MTVAADMKKHKERFIHDMYAIAHGRLGTLIDTYAIAEQYGFDWETLETIVEYWEAKGHIATYQGTLYASLTLEGVEYMESETPADDHQSAKKKDRP